MRADCRVTLSPFLHCLLQVVKLQRALAAERAHVGGLTEALAASQRSHDALVRLRRAEGLRALIEGASFRLHTHGMDVWRPVQLWYSPQDEMLCVAEVRSAGAPAQTSSPAPDVLPRAFPPQVRQCLHLVTSPHTHPPRPQLLSFPSAPMHNIMLRQFEIARPVSLRPYSAISFSAPSATCASARCLMSTTGHHQGS